MMTLALSLLTLLLGLDDSDPLPDLELSETAAISLSILWRPDRVPPDLAQQARDSLSAEDASVLPAIIATMHERPSTSLSLLRSAGDGIVDRAVKNGDAIPKRALARLAAEPELSAQARRAALDWVVRVEPEFRTEFLRSRLNDPVFAGEAVEITVDAGESRWNHGDSAGAILLYKEAFQAVTDPPQAGRIAQRLRNLGHPVDVRHHLGIVADWQVSGPFSTFDGNGASTVWPLTGEFAAHDPVSVDLGRMHWTSVRHKQDAVTLDLGSFIRDRENAVVYLKSVVKSDRQQEIELRGAAAGLLEIWLNGRHVVGSQELDRTVCPNTYRCRARLHAGDNSVLMKFTTSARKPDDPVGKPSTRDVSVRMVDLQGRGVAMNDGK